MYRWQLMSHCPRCHRKKLRLAAVGPLGRRAVVNECAIGCGRVVKEMGVSSCAASETPSIVRDSGRSRTCALKKICLATNYRRNLRGLVDDRRIPCARAVIEVRLTSFSL